MKDVTYKGHTWKEFEASDLDSFDPENADSKRVLSDLSAMVAESRKGVPMDLIFEHQFVDWFNGKAKPAYEEQCKCSIEELFRSSAYADLEAVIAYTRDDAKRDNKPIVLSSFQRVLKYALSWGIGQRNSNQKFRKLQERNARIEKLGHKVCDRCGGSGDWALRAGYTCFKCGGSGYLNKDVA